LIYKDFKTQLDSEKRIRQTAQNAYNDLF